MINGLVTNVLISVCRDSLLNTQKKRHNQMFCSSELVISSDATCILSPSSGSLLDLQLMYKDAQAAAQVKSEPPHHSPAFPHHHHHQAYHHNYEHLLASASHT